MGKLLDIYSVEWNDAVPFAFSGRSVGRQIAAAALLANGIPTRGVIPDVARGVGVNEILTRPWKPSYRGCKLFPVVGAVDIEKRKLEGSGIGRCPTERVLMILIA